MCMAFFSSLKDGGELEVTDVQSIRVKIDGTEYEAPEGSKILDILNQNGIEIPQICHVPEVDPIQTCDTCIVEVNGKLQRSCSTAAENGMSISLTSGRVKEAQTEAMDRLLENHLLYCTVCDNNNGNCTLHNTAEMMGIEHQKYPYTPKDDSKCAVDMSHPFYRYDPNQCIACGQCVEVCQNLQVNETLSIDWERDRPRVIWDEGVAINESSCVSCGQCVTVCPCNALMEKSMLGQAGFMTGIKEDVMEPMIDLVKNVEPDYTSIFAVSEVEAAMRDKRTKKRKQSARSAASDALLKYGQKDVTSLKFSLFPMLRLTRFPLV
ncbi:Formate dehydrogenase related protein [Bacillus amyloliquefaciens]|nr:Formate dehydrogenase related protein [Bacillus amyloliquefaciens]